MFSKLTRTTQCFHGQYQFERKHEYSDRLSELNDWIDCKSQSQAWVSLLTRVEKIKQLISDTDIVQAASDERH